MVVTRTIESLITIPTMPKSPTTVNMLIGMPHALWP